MKLEDLTKQVGRLFSSKHNGGKQVPKLTERLHTLKQIFLGLSLALLLGYSQSRDLFNCQGATGIDAKTLTNFCLTNGTSTVVSDNKDEQVLPSHIGLGVVASDSNDNIVIGHNYIRSLWALFILLAICSYFPQRNWASIFDNETLKALLQLPGHKESKLVLAAEQARPYEMLSPVSRKLNFNSNQRTNLKLSKNELMMYKIEIIEQYNNIYDHKLDYYPNQLIYFLLTKNSTSYKASFLKLKSKLILYSLWSTIFTIMQFILPITFVGLEYILYGWKYANLLKDYLFALVRAHKPVSYVNTIDYSLSMKIFPTSTACDYRQQGVTGEDERVLVQCTVAMNEICGKLFVVIWWIVVINILIEFCSLTMIAIGAINCKLTNLIYGFKYWPAMREQANVIASFRYKRKILEIKLNRTRELRRQMTNKRPNNRLINDKKSSSNGGNWVKNGAVVVLSEKEKKRLEAEREAQNNSSKRTRFNSSSDNTYRQANESWLFACLAGLIVGIFELIGNIVSCSTSRRRNNYENEIKEDVNIYFLLYLLYLRLGKSRSKTEDVIRMTSVALSNYLADLEAQCSRDEEDDDHNNDDDEKSSGEHDDDVAKLEEEISERERVENLLDNEGKKSTLDVMQKV